MAAEPTWGASAASEPQKQTREESSGGDALAEELLGRMRSGHLDARGILGVLQASTHGARQTLLTALAPATVPDASPAPPLIGPEEAPALRVVLLDCARSLSTPPDPTEEAAEARAARASIALQILEALGGAQDLAVAVEATLAGAGSAEDTELARAFERTAQAILARDSKAWGVVRSLAADVPLALAARLLTAVGASDTPLALETLEEFLDRDDGLDAATLSQVARLCAHHAATIQAQFAERLSSFLRSPEAPVREQAALVVGRLEDEESTETLIGLLSDEAPGVRANACWALRRISGLSYGADDPRWQSWYETEVAWWAEDARTLFDDLLSNNRAVLVAAVNELSRHRLARKELVAEIAPLTDAMQPDLVVLACKSLGSLRSRAAVPVLVGLLERPEDAVRAAAGAALGRITGLELPAESQAWNDALASGANPSAAHGQATPAEVRGPGGSQGLPLGGR